MAIHAIAHAWDLLPQCYCTTEPSAPWVKFSRAASEHRMGSVRFQSVLPWVSLFLPPLISLKPHVVSHPLTGITGCLRQELYSHPVFPSTAGFLAKHKTLSCSPASFQEILPSAITIFYIPLKYLSEIPWWTFSMDKKLSWSDWQSYEHFNWISEKVVNAEKTNDLQLPARYLNQRMALLFIPIDSTFKREKFFA